MRDIKNTKQHFIECDCGDSEHQMLFQYFIDDEKWDKPIFLSVHLRTWRNFFRRFWDGIRYIFGYKSRYGAFDEVMLYKDEISNLIEYLQEYLDSFESK